MKSKKRKEGPFDPKLILSFLFHSFRVLVGVVLVVGVGESQSDSFLSLSYAAFFGSLDLVDRLILFGANLNARTKNGNTALVFACMEGHEEIVDRLVSFGADINLPNVLVQTALMEACASENVSIVKMLIGAKADVDQENDQGRKAIDFTCSDEIKAILHGSSLLSSLSLS
jgi:uncharacterized protein